MGLHDWWERDDKMKDFESKVVNPLFRYLDSLPPFWLFFSTDKMETRLLTEIWQGPFYPQLESTNSSQL